MKNYGTHKQCGGNDDRRCKKAETNEKITAKMKADL